MHPFTLERPRDLAAALALRAQAGRNDASAEYIAGGTDMVQLLQEYVRRPDRLVSLAGLLDDGIEVRPRGLRLGAAATMANDVAYDACNKRAPGTGCAAIQGVNRWHAVLGTSEQCIAAHASDLAVALVALDAAVEVAGADGQRNVPPVDFHR